MLKRGQIILLGIAAMAFATASIPVLAVGSQLVRPTGSPALLVDYNADAIDALIARIEAAPGVRRVEYELREFSASEHPIITGKVHFIGYHLEWGTTFNPDYDGILLAWKRSTVFWVTRGQIERDVANVKAAFQADPSIIADYAG